MNIILTLVTFLIPALILLLDGEGADIAPGTGPLVGDRLAAALAAAAGTYAAAGHIPARGSRGTAEEASVAPGCYSSCMGPDQARPAGRRVQLAPPFCRP